MRYDVGPVCKCAVSCSTRLIAWCNMFIGPVYMCSMMYICAVSYRAHWYVEVCPIWYRTYVHHTTHINRHIGLIGMWSSSIRIYMLSSLIRIYISVYTRYVWCIQTYVCGMM